MSESIFARIIRSKGYRATPQRLTILRIVADAGTHISPQEIFELASTKLPGLNEATVYRTLDFLRKEGLVLESFMGSSRVLYEVAEPHHHLVCQKCGVSQDINHELVSPLYHRVAKESGFIIKTNHLTFFGVCQGCAT